jgi:type II secretory pathway pseudopilin PulG
MSLPVRRGFLMLEAAVALLIIGLVAGAALDLRGSQLRAARRGPELVTATTLAQDRLAAVRLLEPEQLSRIPDSVANGRFRAPFADYRWRTSAARTREQQDNLYDIRVQVTWSDGAVVLATRLYAPPTTGRAQ